MKNTESPDVLEKYRGREQIKKFLQAARDAGMDNLHVTTETLLEAGNDRLIEIGSYQHSLDKGHYLVIWKRTSEGKNEWQLDIDIFN
ncbi:unnamed protein product [Rotaria sordida]|uniref:Uncharacterized protein n=1 Tax=Rotaria sordida TaxID=392033 RepID=A0A815RVW0_9BILA|nr:unnamed protein product [Rotaria sordida]CAF1481478.1 unnamed protein product [Rotaria sordida]